MARTTKHPSLCVAEINHINRKERITIDTVGMGIPFKTYLKEMINTVGIDNIPLDGFYIQISDMWDWSHLQVPPPVPERPRIWSDLQTPQQYFEQHPDSTLEEYVFVVGSMPEE